MDRVNLLRETIELLERHGKKLSDIEFIRGVNPPSYKTINHKVDEGTLNEILDLDYDADYGIENINLNLQLVGKDFWLERREYDGSEWWEYRTMPTYDGTPVHYEPLSDDDIGWEGILIGNLRKAKHEQRLEGKSEEPIKWVTW